MKDLAIFKKNNEKLASHCTFIGFNQVILKKNIKDLMNQFFFILGIESLLQILNF